MTPHFEFGESALTRRCTGSPINPAPGDAGRYAQKVIPRRKLV
jgi:hypothetical protein